ncbi:uncharacterized protein EV422DRAFT_539777 [Fimicolochytrium jonesii]|uniref:uncharacterized protein n=1 Tax=Fimicolochytrium jonesii TaxID=1396493 RepID=UPI0022FDBED1|nr:uncharacterized protein EV422DRAFT_539777 [Fimicolochytrium jonesii]KAI8818054.1 hypothetical protein EV422DRAFT_539777 [Fimicolochytrium jonesii]
MHEETRDRIMKVLNWGRKVVHIGYIPLILYLGFTRSSPRPNFLRLISPLAA